MPSSERKARQQRKRDAERARQAAQREAWQVAENARLEALAEDRAPAAQRRGTELRGPLAVPNRQTGGYRADSALARMRRNGRGATVTTDHLKAAERLQRDYETGTLQASPPRAGLVRVDNGTNSDAEDGWLIAAARFRAAQAALGREVWPIVYALAIDNWGLERLATVIGVTTTVVVGSVIAAFDRLVAHYWPERDTRARLVERELSAAMPLGFDYAVSGIGEVIPADRIGRSAPRLQIGA